MCCKTCIHAISVAVHEYRFRSLVYVLFAKCYWKDQNEIFDEHYGPYLLKVFSVFSFSHSTRKVVQFKIVQIIVITQQSIGSWYIYKGVWGDLFTKKNLTFKYFIVMSVLSTLGFLQIHSTFLLMEGAFSQISLFQKQN